MPDTEPQVRSIAVPSVATSVATARRLVADTLQAAGTAPDTVDTAVLLTSEIVTNAVLHARTEVVVSVRVGAGVVVVEVRDGSPALPRPRRHETESITGRGLDLVEMLAADYGIRSEPGGGGKTVWFSLGGAPPEPEHGWQAEVSPAVPVARLCNVPAGLYRVLQQQNEALLREYELFRLDEDRDDGDGDGDDGVGRGDIAAATRARARFATVMLDALEHVPDTGHAEVVVTAEPGELPGIRRLLPVLEAAERVAATGVLLTRPALPELRAFRSWMLGELVAQLDGARPAPWSAPRERDLPDPLLPPLELDTAPFRDETAAVVLADDANRILAVSAAAAELLGWPADELRCQRLTAIVPPGLREAHVTGFTRHLLTGQDRILGQEVEVEAYRRDGTLVPVRLRLQSRRAGARSYYVGWLAPRGR